MLERALVLTLVMLSGVHMSSYYLLSSNLDKVRYLVSNIVLVASFQLL